MAEAVDGDDLRGGDEEEAPEKLLQTLTIHPRPTIPATIA